MEALNKKILEEGYVIEPDILKVDSFLNHQIDVSLYQQMGEEFKRRFKDKPINKILTIESSGIGISVIASTYFDNCPVVFAKKASSKITSGDFYITRVHSFTKDMDYMARIAKDYLNEEDHILIIDDFMANGEACNGLITLCEMAHAKVEGVGIVIEKGFQHGRDSIVEKGIQVESLAIVDGFEGNKVILRENTCI